MQGIGDRVFRFDEGGWHLFNKYDDTFALAKDIFGIKALGSMLETFYVGNAAGMSAYLEWQNL